MFVFYRITPDVRSIFIPLLVIPVILFTLGLGFILSLINGIVRDIGNALSTVITFLMFLTPVLYARPRIGILAPVTKYNPLYYFVSAPRDLVLKGTIPEWRGFVIASVASCIVFVVCLVAFHLTETRVAERV